MRESEYLYHWCKGFMDSYFGEFRHLDEFGQEAYDEGYDYGIEVVLRERYDDNKNT